MESIQIAAIITCYFPKNEELTPLLASINNQVDVIFLVDNGGLANFSIPESIKSKIEVISANKNLGTAGGYNLGCRRAWEKKCSHVLLLDQDSECDQDMVKNLISLETYLKKNSEKVAVVGPYYICKSNNQPAPFIQHEGLRIRRIYETDLNLPKSSNNQKYTPCSYVISSGSLISRQSWNDIGETYDGLFLDFTDIEWGLRSATKGYQCYGSFDAKMYHIIGDEQLSLLGRKISLHSPLRHYYAFRNCVWLAKQNYVPGGTRFNYLIKLAPKLLVYSWFSSEPLQQLKSMILGVKDGIFNRMGAFQK
ncbi:MAG: glycosyltransferase family 2 protein [Bdellovibrionaceae bacterium]|nr:glycosyltransferase family 2 protein [Pseudobdellovibrionaceae bacterium]